MFNVSEFTGLIGLWAVILSILKEVFPHIKNFVKDSIFCSYRIDDSSLHSHILEDVRNHSVGPLGFALSSNAKRADIDYGTYYCKILGRWVQVYYRYYSARDEVGFYGDNIIVTTLRFRAGDWEQRYLTSLRERQGEERRRLLTLVLGRPHETVSVKRVPRPVGSLAYKSDLLGDLSKDILTFMESEERYRESGRLYKRVYLLSGDPGTGKSTLALWLATVAGKDVRVIPPLKSGTDLVRAMSEYHESILLLEDVDCLMGELDRKPESGDEDDEEGGVLNVLLNAMDGPYTPHGMIMILTTNYPERLDVAFRRSGRTDRWVSIETPPLRDLHHFFKHMAPGLDSHEVQKELEGMNLHLTPSDMENLLWECSSMEEFRGRQAEMKFRKAKGNV